MNLQLLDGKTFREMADYANTLAALGQGNYHRWEFGPAKGVVFATDTACVFFNENDLAFTCSFTRHIEKQVRDRFMEVASQAHQREKDLRPLMEIMETDDRVLPRIGAFEHQLYKHPDGESVC